MATHVLMRRRRLYRNGAYSDLVVESADKQYRVHKAVVCTRSSFFAAACEGPFKVSCWSNVVCSLDLKRGGSD